MYTFELNNLHRDDVQIKDAHKFQRFVEICSALFNGTDVERYGKEKDQVVAKIKALGANAEMGDWKARAEINEIFRYIVEPKLLESMKILSFMGNYHELKYNEQPRVETYTYANLDAREQASGSDVNFSNVVWEKYPVVTHTISSGMAIDYRELRSGNFAGNEAEQLSQVQIDMNNKSIAFTLDVVRDALKNNTDYVKFYATYSGALTQSAVDDMIAKIRKMGKVNIIGDYSVLSAICEWNGYKTVGSENIPFFSSTQVDELARAGLNGFYKGASLIELPNRYNFTKPLADKTAFETYYNTDDLYFTAQGQNSPLNIFRRGGITTMSGNDVETGVVKTRFDMEIGADVVRGREFEIGLISKAE